jgi:hypothetical protein
MRMLKRSKCRDITCSTSESRRVDRLALTLGLKLATYVLTIEPPAAVAPENQDFSVLIRESVPFFVEIFDSNILFLVSEDPVVNMVGSLNECMTRACATPRNPAPAGLPLPPANNALANWRLIKLLRLNHHDLSTVPPQCPVLRLRLRL